MKRYYMGGCYELDQQANGNYKEKLYLGGDYYSAPAVYVRENGGSWNIYYICRDYLGSITHIANSSGSLVQELSYDPWGRLRNPSTYVPYTPGNEPELFLGRGYTGHEHLTQFGLINMNARLYDPAIGRFLSPDPFVQAPDFSQSFNRYSYAWNNPLKYTDPTGEYALIDDLIAALLGGTINWIVNGCQFNGAGAAYFGVGFVGGVATIYVGPWAGGAIIGAGNDFVGQGFAGGSWNWSNIKGQQVLFAGIMGGMTGELGAGLSGMLSPSISNLTSGLGGQALQQGATQALTGAATGFALGTGVALMNGESFGDALSAGGKGALNGLAIGAVSGMVSGMRSAYKDGENPWTGAQKSTNNISNHAVQRTNERNISQSDINDALKNPLKVTEVQYRENGPSVKYIGNKATVVVNPETGNIITVIPTGTKVALKLGGRR
jgi:RHS repeat-associated protein